MQVPVTEYSQTRESCTIFMFADYTQHHFASFFILCLREGTNKAAVKKVIHLSLDDLDPNHVRNFCNQQSKWLKIKIFGVLNKYIQLMSNQKGSELSVLTALLTTQRYHPVWFLLIYVIKMKLWFPSEKVEKFPLRVWRCHMYWIGSVPFFTLHLIRIVDPSTGTSLNVRMGLLTETV